MRNVTVLMALYNAAPYLKESIESIINQTYRDFEFLIIDDGSTDRSVDIVESFNDPRIKLFHNDGNRGLIYTLNRGFELVKTKYLVRQDADDVSVLDRVEKLVNFMEKNPEVTICSSSFTYFNEPNKIFRQPETNDEIKVTALSRCPLTHGASIIRLNEFKINELWYDPEYIHAEDFEMLTRACQKVKLYNLSEPLYCYRKHDEQISNLYSREQITMDDKIRLKYASETLHINFQDIKDISYLKLIRPLITGTGNKEMKEVFRWKEILLEHNERRRFFNPNLLKKMIFDHMSKILYIRQYYGFKLWLYMIELSLIHRYFFFNMKQFFIFTFRCFSNYENVR